MIIPPFLQPGDKVGIVAPAKKVNEKTTLDGIEVLKSWGLQVIMGKNLFKTYHQFAGTDDQRIEDFQQMIDDHEIKGIFMARGGYGSTRIIDRINFEALINTPKWICGFSDITAIHLHLYNLGIASLHAPMPSFFHDIDKQDLLWFRDYIFGIKSKLVVNKNQLNKSGLAHGKLIGGNLSLICHTIGTPSEITTKNNILFIEDVGEQLYNLDRMMVQLKRIGLLKNLSGLMVGQFSEMKDSEDSFGQSAYEIIHAHTKDHDYPIAFDLPIGHTAKNHAIPIGLPATLNVNESRATLMLD